MLTLLVSEKETFNQVTQTFETLHGCILRLEHSLVAVSKWEAIHKRSFLSSKGLAPDELLSYISQMNTTQNINPEVFSLLSNIEMAKVLEYIRDPHSATKFADKNNRPSREIITSELIYYWMITFNIPFEAQKWHLNRLLTLIKICIMKSEKPKKFSKAALHKRNATLNAARRQRLNSRG
jgi:hypothetical protein